MFMSNHLYYSIIDTHSYRQGILGLEDCWPTKSPWFRLVTTLIGMSVVDLHRWDRSKRSGGGNFDWINADDDRPDFLKVRSMANLIARGIKSTNMQYYRESNPRATIPIRVRAINNFSYQHGLLTRITNRDGLMRRPNGKKQEYQKTCFICRQYRKRPVNTVWWCSVCHMPLCKMSRKRELTCVQEHERYADDPHLGCHEGREYFQLPPQYRMFGICNNNNNNGTSGNDDDDDHDGSGDGNDNNNNGGKASDSDSDSNDSLLATFRTGSDSNNRREFGGTGVSAGNKSQDRTFEPRITRSTTAGNRRRTTTSASRRTIL